MARAYSLAQASIVAPFEYASLPISVLWGFLLWQEVPTAMTWLGAALTLFITVPDQGLLISLGVFAGFLLYIGASDVLPEAHADHPSGGTILMTLAGTGVMYVVVDLLP